MPFALTPEVYGRADPGPCRCDGDGERRRWLPRRAFDHRRQVVGDSPGCPRGSASVGCRRCDECRGERAQAIFAGRREPAARPAHAGMSGASGPTLNSPCVGYNSAATSSATSFSSTTQVREARSPDRGIAAFATRTWHTATCWPSRRSTSWARRRCPTGAARGGRECWPGLLTRRRAGRAGWAAPRATRRGSASGRRPGRRTAAASGGRRATRSPSRPR